MKFLKLFLLAIGITVSLYSCQQDLDFISDDAQLKMNEQSITKLKKSSLIGSCSGRLEYYDTMSNYQTEKIHKRVIVPL